MKLFKRQGTSIRQVASQSFSSIRFRLVLWFVLVLAIVMALFSMFVYWRQVQDIHSIAQSRLNFLEERFLGSEHERELEGESLPPVSSANSGYFQGLNLNPFEGNILAIMTPDGTVLQSAGVLTAQQIGQLDLPNAGWDGVRQVRVPKNDNLESSHYLFISLPILHDGQLSGYFMAGAPLDPNNQLNRLALSLILGNLLTLWIALLGGFWLADRAMRPVHTITQTARQISETDLNKRLHLTGKDELSELANTFDAMLDRLQAAFERQRQFTADASHELRTPLTIIDLESSRALSNRRSVDEYERILNTIQSENQFMIRLVNNLLALARMDSGQLSLADDPLDLGDLTLEVVERMRPLADAKGVEIIVGDLPELSVRGDGQTLAQMITNLVENGIKYSATVAHPQVSVSGGKTEESGRQEAWVRISDNGIGINPEHQAHIFDRFYQVDAARTRLENLENEPEGQGSSGTGLGLAIAQWIAQDHHGEIRVHSTLGQGSTFEVLLPAVHQGK